jgi:formimidoylglutamate deiminase
MAHDTPRIRKQLKVDQAVVGISPTSVKILSPAYFPIDEQGFLCGEPSSKAYHQEAPPDAAKMPNVAVNPVEIQDEPGLFIPSFVNGHSHALQYAMVGRSEYRSLKGEQDSFWSWRDHMYRLCLAADPDDLFHIARALYTEMLRMGYTHVCEFHYLHHEKSGKPYSQLPIMSIMLMEAAKEARIGMTLVPIDYRHGGFSQPARPEQRRFLSAEPQDFLKLWREIQQYALGLPHCHLSAGFHSLRAVTCAEMNEIASELPGIDLHIHISEQELEVSQCLKATGTTPIAWLQDQVGLDSRWHLVHATQANERERDLIAKSGAKIVLCPSTEANLGDGVFAWNPRNTSPWTIGSDSQVGLNPWRELQLLEYMNRMTLKKRNVATLEAGEFTALRLLQHPWSVREFRTGLKWSSADRLWREGQALSGILYDSEDARICSLSPEETLSYLTFGPAENLKHRTIQRGQVLAQDPTPVNTSPAAKSFLQTLANLYPT